MSKLDFVNVGVCCAAFADFVLAGVVVAPVVDVLLAVLATGVLLMFSFLLELSDDVEDTFGVAENEVDIFSLFNFSKHKTKAQKTMRAWSTLAASFMSSPCYPLSATNFSADWLPSIGARKPSGLKLLITSNCC